MSKYGLDNTMSEACVETPKMLKKRIKMRETVLEDFIEISKVIDMDWKEKHAAIGTLYLEIRDMKIRLKGK